MEDQLQYIDNLLTNRDLKKAEVAIGRLIRADLAPADQSEILVRRAQARLLSGRPEDALNDLATMRTLTPTDTITAPILELTGDCYFARFELASVGFADRNDILQAQHYYHQIIQEHPHYTNIGWVYYQLGRIAVILGEIEAALKHFHQALLNPSQVSALTAFCYERIGFISFYELRELERALSFLDRAIDTYPTRAEKNWLIQVFLLKSRVLRGMQQLEKALEAAKTSLTMVADSPDNKLILSEALLSIGELLAQLGNRDKEVIATLQQFTQIRKRPPGVDVTWSRVNEMLGNAYFNLAQYENAIEAYQAVLQFNPDHPWALSLYYRMAKSYYQLRAYDNTIKVIDVMVKMATREDQPIDDYRIYDMLGNAQFALGAYEPALLAYQTALAMAPANADNIDKIKSYRDMARERLSAGEHRR